MEKLVPAEIVRKKVQNSGKTRKHNLSSYFLLPIVSSYLSKDKNFINSYLFDMSNDITNGNIHIYVLMSSENNELPKKDLYITHRQVKRGYLYTFDISYYLKDIELFIQGKYSKFSEELKELLCDRSGIKNVMLSEIYKILYRTQERREKIEELIGQKLDDDAEVASSPDLADEIFMEEREYDRPEV